MFFQLLITGVLLGGVYALTSIGLSLIFGVSRVINFAHGDFVMVGMYLAYTIYQTYHINPYLSWIAVAPVTFIIGWFIYRLIIHRTVGKPDVIQIFVTLGLSLVLQNLALMIYRTDFRTVSTEFGMSSYKLGSMMIPKSSLVAFLISIAVTAIIFWVINHTDFGRSMRAVSEDRHAAKLMGIPVKRVDMLVFALGIAMAGLAGALLVTLYPVYPTVGSVLNLLAWITVVLGGLGRVGGAFMAALIIGISETLSGYYLGSDMRQFVYYTLFIAVLILRPQGLFSGAKKVR